MVKQFRRYFYSFWHESHDPRTRQTARRTDTACRHIPRLCIASRGTNCSVGSVKCSFSRTDIKPNRTPPLQIHAKIFNSFTPFNRISTKAHGWYLTIRPTFLPMTTQWDFSTSNSREITSAISEHLSSIFCKPATVYRPNNNYRQACVQRSQHRR